MKLWVYILCIKIIDNVFNGRPKCNHKAIEERIKRLVNYVFIKMNAKV